MARPFLLQLPTLKGIIPWESALVCNTTQPETICCLGRDSSCGLRLEGAGMTIFLHPRSHEQHRRGHLIVLGLCRRILNSLPQLLAIVSKMLSIFGISCYGIPYTLLGACSRNPLSRISGDRLFPLRYLRHAPSSLYHIASRGFTSSDTFSFFESIAFLIS